MMYLIQKFNYFIAMKCFESSNNRFKFLAYPNIDLLHWFKILHSFNIESDFSFILLVKLAIGRSTHIKLKIDLPRRINIQRGESSRNKIQLETSISFVKGRFGVRLGIAG